MVLHFPELYRGEKIEFRGRLSTVYLLSIVCHHSRLALPGFARSFIHCLPNNRLFDIQENEVRKFDFEHLQEKYDLETVPALFFEIHICPHYRCANSLFGRVVCWPQIRNIVRGKIIVKTELFFLVCWLIAACIFLQVCYGPAFNTSFVCRTKFFINTKFTGQ